MRWMSVAAWMLLIPALLLTALLIVSGSDALYGALQSRYVGEAETGVSDGDRARLNRCLAEYIRGERDDLVVTATVYGAEMQAFNETEISHMRDVRALFDLARGLRMGLLLAGSALLAVPAVRRLRAVWTGFLVASGAWIAAIVGVGAWAATDFTRAFVAFHRLLFTNELWILDPHTDLLIRLLPEMFFADMAAAVVIGMVGLLAIAGAAAWWVARGISPSAYE